MKLTQDDVDNILRIIGSPCVELHLETSDFKLFVRKVGSLERTALNTERPAVGNGREPLVAALTTSSPLYAPPPASPLAPAEVRLEPPALQVAQPARALAAGECAVAAPMMGTFYSAPSPGAAPFVELGDAVEPETVVCIIEVMKLMNSIRAERRGRVTEILIENGQLVQTGQPLVVIESAG